jgi:hypothetical protein
MNDLNALTEVQLDAVSGGDKSTVPVKTSEPTLIGAGSPILAAVEKAGDLIGTGHF